MQDQRIIQRPEGMILGYNSMYFDDPKGSALLGVADGRCMATVRRQDIDEHAAKAAAGSASVA